MLVPRNGEAVRPAPSRRPGGSSMFSAVTRSAIDGARPSPAQPLLPLPRNAPARLRSCRRTFTPAPTPGPYRLPHDVRDRLAAAITPYRNRDAAGKLSEATVVYLGEIRTSTPSPLRNPTLEGALERWEKSCRKGRGPQGRALTTAHMIGEAEGLGPPLCIRC